MQSSLFRCTALFALAMLTLNAPAAGDEDGRPPAPGQDRARSQQPPEMMSPEQRQRFEKRRRALREHQRAIREHRQGMSEEEKARFRAIQALREKLDDVQW